MIKHFLSFEKQISDLEGKIEELRHLSSGGDINIAEEIGKLQGAVAQELKSTYSKLTPWQKVQVSRHPERPHFQDIVKNLFDDYIPLSGDRNFSDDNALTGGTAFFRKKSVIVIGIDKGKNTTDRISKNFGMVRPEGYRKAVRLMDLANKFSLPVLMFVDTAGAYPGKGAEERGQAQAIASCIQKSLEISVPTISIITGEGGCESEASDEFAYSTVGISTNRTARIKVYPNPATEQLSIDLELNDASVKFKIISLTGQVVENSDLTSGKNNVDVSSLNSGVYLLQLKGAGGNLETIRLVID